MTPLLHCISSSGRPAVRRFVLYLHFRDLLARRGVKARKRREGSRSRSRGGGDRSSGGGSTSGGTLFFFSLLLVHVCLCVILLTRVSASEKDQQARA